MPRGHDPLDTTSTQMIGRDLAHGIAVITTSTRVRDFSGATSIIAETVLALSVHLTGAA